MLLYLHRYGSTYYQAEYANTWRRVTLPITNEDVYGTAVKLRWRQEFITTMVAGEWALDNIVIGNRSVHCPQLCNGHGRCTLQSICVCDEGFSGNDCEMVDGTFPNRIHVQFTDTRTYTHTHIQHTHIYMHTILNTHAYTHVHTVHTYTHT